MSEPVTPGAYAKALIEKRAAAKRRRIVLGASIGGTLLLLIIGVAVAFFSPAFATKTVQVSGMQLLTKEQVIDAARVPIGLPLPRQDQSAIEARVKELAPVSDVRVSLAWPNAVEIKVAERQLSYQRVVDGKYAWVDKTGAVFHTTTKPEPGAVQATTKGDEQRLLVDVATVVEALPVDVRSQVVMVKADAVDQITLSLTEKRTVVWGSAEQSDVKAQVLAALLSVEASTYDVSAPEHPTTK